MSDVRSINDVEKFDALFKFDDKGTSKSFTSMPQMRKIAHVG